MLEKALKMDGKHKEGTSGDPLLTEETTLPSETIKEADLHKMDEDFWASQVSFE